MKVSILIPTLNRLPYLRESLASARAQRHPDLEILVSDDGSTDGTRAHVEEVAQIDPRVRLMTDNPRQGLYENYNHLIERATGDAFGILDDDDRWLPDCVERLVEPMERDRNVAAVFCDHWIISADGHRQESESERNSRLYGRAGLGAGVLADPITVTMGGGLSVVFALFRHDMVKQERFALDCDGAADVDYALRLGLKDAPLHYVNARLGEYRVYHTRTTTTRTAWMLDGAVKVLKKYEFADPRHEALRRRRLHDAYRAKAMYVCTRSRSEWWRTIRACGSDGGSLLRGGILLSALLAALPHSMGERVRGWLKDLRSKYTQAMGPGVALG